MKIYRLLSNGRIELQASESRNLVLRINILMNMKKSTKVLVQQPISTGLGGYKSTSDYLITQNASGGLREEKSNVKPYPRAVSGKSTWRVMMTKRKF